MAIVVKYRYNYLKIIKGASVKTTKTRKTDPRDKKIIGKLRVILTKDKTLKSSLQEFLR